MFQVYENVSELLPSDAPEPLGESVTLTHCADADLTHGLTTGHSIKACLHFVNDTPIDWHSKRQAVVDTTTHRSEMVATRTCVKPIIDLQATLHCLGGNLHPKGHMFNDNKSIVNSSTQNQAKWTKNHTIFCPFTVFVKQLCLDV